LNIDYLYQLYRQHPSVQTDTRKLKKGDIFFALSGPNFNGNQFAFAALETGASYAIVDQYLQSTDERIIKVDDALIALQQLALHHRKQFTIPFIAITGSNGKTTTKELVNAVLASHYITYTTQGNLNNHIGIPLTILSVEADAQFAVIEMGANHQKEIEGYCKYTLPTHGIITNCGKAHLEGFGGIEGVKKGKGELFDFLRNNNGTAFIFNDYDYLQEMSKDIATVIKYGTSLGDVVGKVISSEPFLEVEITNGFQERIATQLVGDYNVPNVLCAVAVGKHFGVPLQKIKKSIQEYAPSNSRSQMVEVGTNHVILDAYNANPTSTKAAIENLAKIKADNKVLMLGGMMELGEESVAEHQSIVELIEQYNWKEVVLVGGNYKHASHKFHFFNDVTEAREWFNLQQFNNCYILIKGSRSIKMEEILEA
jgi:UDP-N-acetylmuramoyl-tripeptide--D-alanyl-D-alanine ligase